MVKRQRTLSPPPKSVLASTPDSIELPDSKRPRRHINNESCRIRFDDGDKESVDEDVEGERRGIQEKAVTTPYESPVPSVTSVAAKYEPANSLLYEVHILRQHHLLFSPPRLSDPAANLHATKPAPLPPERFGPAAALTLDTQNDTPSNQADASEVQRVREHYESNNKLLGSLFLSRKRNPLHGTGAPNSNIVL